MGLLSLLEQDFDSAHRLGCHSLGRHNPKPDYHVIPTYFRSRLKLMSAIDFWRSRSAARDETVGATQRSLSSTSLTAQRRSWRRCRLLVTTEVCSAVLQRRTEG